MEPTLTTYEGTDFYCDVALPNVGDLDVIVETDRVLAYRHTRPTWETHIVVIPKRHLGSFTSVTADDEDDVRALFLAVQHVARQVEETTGAASIVTNLGRYQDSKHFHVHVHSGARIR